MRMHGNEGGRANVSAWTENWRDCGEWEEQVIPRLANKWGATGNSLVFSEMIAMSTLGLEYSARVGGGGSYDSDV